MKIKLSLLIILLVNTCYGQDLIKTKYKSTYKDGSKPVFINLSNGVKVRSQLGHAAQPTVTAFRGNTGTDLVVLGTAADIIQVAEYDLNSDGIAEIIVAYEVDLTKNVEVFSNTNFKKLGDFVTSDYIYFKDGKIYSRNEHADNIELNLYALKSGKLVWVDEKALVKK